MRNYIDINDSLVEYLHTLIGDKKVLEVFAGSGDLASALLEKGCYVTPTGIYSRSFGNYSKPEHVIDLEAVKACRKYKDSHDILLASFPVTDDAFFLAAKEFEGPIILIGELYHKHPLNTVGSYSGTASDAYYDNVIDITPPKAGLIDNLSVYVFHHKMKENPKHQEKLMRYYR